MSAEEFEDLTTDPKFQEYLNKSGYTLSKLKDLRERKKKSKEKKKRRKILYH
jgi:hypothetical protein